MSELADLVPVHWSTRELSHNPQNAATGGIWRVNRDTDTAILKIATPPRGDHPEHWATSDDPGHWNYWRRELLAYRTGLTRAYVEAGIRAPDLLDVTERADGSVALWLEDVDGVPGTACSVPQLGDLAHRLGVAQAGWLDRPSTVDWLARDWLRDYTTARLVREPLDWDHPVAVQTWPARLRDDLRALWTDRHRVLAATDRLPWTLCHHDVWPMNVLVDRAGPVLVDWTFVGPGPVGADAANLIVDTFLDGFVATDRLDEVVAAVGTGYGRGVAGAVSSPLIRQAIMLTGAAKYFWLAPRMLNQLADPADRSLHYDRRDDVAMFAGRRPILELLVDWFRRVR